MSDKLTQIEEGLKKLTEELQKLKSEEAKPAVTLNQGSGHDYEKNEEYIKLKKEFDEAQTHLMKLMQKMLVVNPMYIAACFAAVKCDSGCGTGCGTAIGNFFLDDIAADGLSSALEPFTNPKRLAILFALTKEPLTSGEISKKTDCIGGQLYHHLSILEAAGLIKKTNNKYELDGHSINVVVGLIAAVGGTKVARGDGGGEEVEAS